MRPLPGCNSQEYQQQKETMVHDIHMMIDRLIPEDRYTLADYSQHRHKY